MLGRLDAKEKHGCILGQDLHMDSKTRAEWNEKVGLQRLYNLATGWHAPCLPGRRNSWNDHVLRTWVTRKNVWSYEWIRLNSQFDIWFLVTRQNPVARPSRLEGRERGGDGGGDDARKARKTYWRVTWNVICDGRRLCIGGWSGHTCHFTVCHVCLW